MAAKALVEGQYATSAPRLRCVEEGGDRTYLCEWYSDGEGGNLTSKIRVDKGVTRAIVADVDVNSSPSDTPNECFDPDGDCNPLNG